MKLAAVPASDGIKDLFDRLVHVVCAVKFGLAVVQYDLTERSFVGSADNVELHGLRLNILGIQIIEDLFRLLGLEIAVVSAVVGIVMIGHIALLIKGLPCFLHGHKFFVRNGDLSDVVMACGKELAVPDRQRIGRSAALDISEIIRCAVLVAVNLGIDRSTRAVTHVKEAVG